MGRARPSAPREGDGRPRDDGAWERTWRGEPVYEIGWSVLPPFQGRGIAGMAIAQAITVARSEGKHRFLHAFPSVDNLPSNTICRKLGFTLDG